MTGRSVAHTGRGVLAAALGLILLVALGCSGPGHNRRGDRDHSRDAVITFDCPVRDAEVWVDGRYLVDGLRRGISLAPGDYRIEIRHDRYHTLYFEVTVAAGEHRVITARPAEILP